MTIQFILQAVNFQKYTSQDQFKFQKVHSSEYKIIQIAVVDQIKV